MAIFFTIRRGLSRVAGFPAIIGLQKPFFCFLRGVHLMSDDGVNTTRRRFLAWSTAGVGAVGAGFVGVACRAVMVKAGILREDPAT